MWKRLLRFLKPSAKKRSPRRKKPAPRHRARRKRRPARAKRRVPARKSSRKRPVKRVKRPAKKSRPAAKKAPRPTAEITHYFPRVHAAVLKLHRPLRIGDPIRIKGQTTDFRQTVGSLQINREPITTARPGQDVGLEVLRDVRQGDKIFLVEGKRR